MADRALTVQTGQYRALADFLEKKKSLIQGLAGKHFDSDRMIRLLLHATTSQPKLLEAAPLSVLKFLMDCAALGLQRIGPHGVWPVPFNNKIKGPDGRERWMTVCTPIIDYRALVDFAIRGGHVASMKAYPVYEKDEFRLELGDAQRLVHVPVPLDADRGALRGVYSIARLVNGEIEREVMRVDEIRAVMGRSKAAAKGFSPWQTDFVPMGLKSCLRRHSTHYPMPEAIEEVIQRVEAEEFDSGNVIDLDGYGDAAEIEAQSWVEPEEEKPPLVERMQKSAAAKRAAPAAPKKDVDEDLRISSLIDEANEVRKMRAEIQGVQHVPITSFSGTLEEAKAHRDRAMELLEETQKAGGGK